MSAPDELCAWCGRTYGEHADERLPGTAVPRVPCTLLKVHFRAKEKTLVERGVAKLSLAPDPVATPTRIESSSTVPDAPKRTIALAIETHSPHVCGKCRFVAKCFDTAGSVVQRCKLFSTLLIEGTRGPVRCAECRNADVQEVAKP